MALIHDTDDERRARVEALICELLNAQRHTSAQGDELATSLASAKRLDGAPNRTRVSRPVAK
jgi:hypothetical protein